MAIRPRRPYRKRGIRYFEPAALTPIPLRNGLTVFIQGLPDDITEAEAAKICRVVTALATPLPSPPTNR